MVQLNVERLNFTVSLCSTEKDKFREKFMVLKLFNEIFRDGLEQLILGKTENSSDQLVECGVKKTKKRLKKD